VARAVPGPTTIETTAKPRVTCRFPVRVMPSTSKFVRCGSALTPLLLPQLVLSRAPTGGVPVSNPRVLLQLGMMAPRIFRALDINRRVEHRRSCVPSCHPTETHWKQSWKCCGGSCPRVP
jgi:hypothetical protein